VPETTDNASDSITAEIEQYAYDQSLANDENTGMIAAVFANLLILAIAAVVIIVYARKKSSKNS